MLLDANQKIFDASLRHQVALRRLSTSFSNDLAARLSEADRRLVSQLRSELGDIWSLGDKNKLRSALTSIRKGRADLAEVADETLDRFAELARAEAAFEHQLLSRNLPVEVNVATVAPDIAERVAVNKPFNGKPMKGWFKNLLDADRGRLNDVVVQGFTNGETLDDLVRRVAGTRANGYKDGMLATTRRNAEALVRTGVNHTSNAARETVWEKNADIIWGLRWTATLDGRTSTICASRDGAVAPMGDGDDAPSGLTLLDPAGARPPAHVNCRSTVVPMVSATSSAPERPFVRDHRTRAQREKDFRREAREADPEEWKKMSPVQRDQVIKGKRDAWRKDNVGTVPGSTTYEEWMRRQPEDFQNATMGPSRAKLFRSGKLKLDKFHDAGGRTRSLEELDQLLK